MRDTAKDLVRPEYSRSESEETTYNKSKKKAMARSEKRASEGGEKPLLDFQEGACRLTIVTNARSKINKGLEARRSFFLILIFLFRFCIKTKMKYHSPKALREMIFDHAGLRH
ncbi:MAG: hypothetical protein H6600_03720 [Flavobacteriales bacterium]|nr:hypothetical protein [Flavobacteriales bacterium]